MFLRGALVYADDVTIMAPTIHSLQSMLNICDDLSLNMKLCSIQVNISCCIILRKENLVKI